ADREGARVARGAHAAAGIDPVEAALNGARVGARQRRREQRRRGAHGGAAEEARREVVPHRERRRLIDAGVAAVMSVVVKRSIRTRIVAMVAAPTALLFALFASVV